MNASVPPAPFTVDTQVFIVDDTDEYAEILRRVLQFDFGFTKVQRFISPEAALKDIPAEFTTHAIIFIDFNFPGELRGSDLLSALHKRPDFEWIVPFLITSEPSPELLSQTQKLGAHGLISKPFSRDTLRQQIVRAAAKIEP